MRAAGTWGSENRVELTLPKVKTGFRGFTDILELEKRISTSGENLHSITISDWMDANMCAPLGAILDRQVRAGMDVRFASIHPEDILRKNGFLSQFGRPPIADTHSTTIAYHKFRPRDNASFQDYIGTHFRKRCLGLPKMSEALLRKFRESLFEVYENAVDHSETQIGIFACGQFYPARHRLDFSIADLGVGMRERIKRDLSLDMSPPDAVSWAMEGNTTRRGRRPGGLGLQLIREFIALNGGRIIVVSDAGYWELKGSKLQARPLEWPFPGTVVTIEVNTADAKSYRLTSEINPNEIF
jgi:hypothetical protein